MFARDNTEQVPGASFYESDAGVAWGKTVGDRHLAALSGCWLWRAMVTHTHTRETLHISAHQFKGPCAAMDHAEKWLRNNRP